MSNRQPSKPASAPIAVIDIGTTFIRMLIAEKRGRRGVHVLEKAVQSVAIGQDIVAARRISNATAARCVEILDDFRRLLDEYGIAAEDVTAVASATLQQADNGEAFLDRLSNTAALDFRLLDPGQLGYYYHLAFRAINDSRGNWEKGEAAVIDIGGLTCCVLCRKQGEIRYVQTFGVGSLQLRNQMEEAGLRPQQLGALTEGRTREIAEQIRKNTDSPRTIKLLLMGREMRFAARLLRPDRRLAGAAGPVVTRLDLGEVEALLARLETTSVEAMVRRWQISYPDADMLVPSLHIVLAIARELGIKTLHVSGVSFSHGLIEEAVGGETWSTAMRKHVLRIARETGEKYQYDAAHAGQVAKIALDLFDLLQPEHGCTDRHRLLLEVAALLHDIGVFVSVHGHHKHTMYLLRNTEFAGLSSREIELIAVVCRYHRRSIPKLNHPEYFALRQDERLLVGKLAAVLRVADALDRVHDQSLGRVAFELGADTLSCIPVRQVATGAEEVALAEKSELFELMFGRRCVIRNPG